MKLHVFIFIGATATTPKRNRGFPKSSILDSPLLKMPKSPISPITTPKRKRQRESDDESEAMSKRDRKYSPHTWTMKKKVVAEHDLVSVVGLYLTFYRGLCNRI
jgi:hypothetical protein